MRRRITGKVSPNGRRAVYPTGTATYTLTATNAGGNSTASTTITVSTPPPPAPVAAPAGPSAAEILAKQVQDLHFDYDKSDVRPADQPILQGDATALKTIFGMDPNFVITIEGHCDERGTAEYNLALGERRAVNVRAYLVSLGISADRLRIVSYGKEFPFDPGHDETAWAKNRRAHFVITAK